MPNKKAKKVSFDTLTKRQASVINKGNRKLSGNINALMNNLSNATYGIQKSDVIDSLVSDFNQLMKPEIDSISKVTDGDTTSFLTKLVSQNNKRIASEFREISDLFNTNEGQLESFISEQYKNTLVKQGDLHEIASQLVELREAISITRDAIISADIINGHMSRVIEIENDEMEKDDGDYIPIIEKMEEKFRLQEKIKNFIIPRSLEYGEYYVYAIPYSKLFEDFSREKLYKGRQYTSFAESTVEGFTLSEFVNKREERKKDWEQVVTESVSSNKEYQNPRNSTKSVMEKSVREEANKYLENIVINNNAIPIPIMEEGLPTIREYYTEFVENVVSEADENSFETITRGIDKGIHPVSTKGGFSKPNNKYKVEDFSNFRECYIKLIDPIHLLPIEIMDEVIGYYYIQEEDITPLSGILTSTMYYGNYNTEQNKVLASIAETIVDAFDKKFLEKNMKFKKLIVEALNYYKLNNQRLKFQFIPKEFIIPFTVNEDENGKGVSIIEPSLFYAKLYLMLLLFKMMSIIENSNDTKVNYVRRSGIDKDMASEIQEIARKKQERKILLPDLFAYTTLIGKIGAGSEMYVPVGKQNERGIETEILAGQDVQLNTELMEMLKKAYISGTGVPDVLMNYINEADFAKTLELANNNFQGRVVSYQLDFNRSITNLYRHLAKYSTTIPENIINTLEFNFVEPKSSNGNITNELMNTHNSLQELITGLYFPQNQEDPKIMKFKLMMAKSRLAMLNWDEFDKFYKLASIEGTEEILNPDAKEDEDNM